MAESTITMNEAYGNYWRSLDPPREMFAAPEAIPNGGHPKAFQGQTNHGVSRIGLLTILLKMTTWDDYN